MAASYHDYDPATLARLQALLHEMLADFDALCHKHGLHYFAGGGTAIGALRHGGMIPWDDDIDLNFLRADYERFLEVAEKEYGDKYYVVNARKYPDYPLMTTRWCLRGTVFREECFRDLDVPLGIFLDIYFFDPIPDDEAKARRQWRRAWLWGKLMILRQTMTKVIDSLEAKGYVERASHSYDRRKVYINLLPEGQRLARELLCLESDYLDRVDRQFTDEEMETYRDLSRRIQDARAAVMQEIVAERDAEKKEANDA